MYHNIIIILKYSIHNAIIGIIHGMKIISIISEDEGPREISYTTHMSFYRSSRSDPEMAETSMENYMSILDRWMSLKKLQILYINTQNPPPPIVQESRLTTADRANECVE